MNSKYTLTHTLMLLLLAASTTVCIAIEPRWYSMQARLFPVDGQKITNSEQHDIDTCSKICDLRVAANRRFRCKAIDQIDIGTGKKVFRKVGSEVASDTSGLVLDYADENKNIVVMRTPIYLSRAAITKLLKREKERNLLVVTLLNHEDFSRRSIFDQYNKFFDSLGYSRVLVLGTTNKPGILVLRDTQEERSK